MHFGFFPTLSIYILLCRWIAVFGKMIT